MNASAVTTLCAAALTAVSYFVPWFAEQIRMVGLFALSGALTNWLAVHMLFEKVPGLYGSGIVPSRFEELKSSIRRLIMTQFFSEEKVAAFFDEEDQGGHLFDPDPIVDVIDYDKVFTSFTDVAMESSFGSVLNLAGGKRLFEPLRDPVKSKVREQVRTILRSDDFHRALRNSIQESHIAEDIVRKAKMIVESRLHELTPELVKQIVQDMIREHLGWLVVWGGVFGGLMGLIAGLLA